MDTETYEEEEVCEDPVEIERRRQVRERRQAREKWSEERAHLIDDLRQQGLTFREIAEKLKVSRQRVYQIAAERGIS